MVQSTALLHKKHVAGLLDGLLDVSLFLGGQTRKFAGKYLARFGNKAIQGIGVREIEFACKLSFLFFCHIKCSVFC